MQKYVNVYRKNYKDCKCENFSRYSSAPIHPFDVKNTEYGDMLGRITFTQESIQVKESFNQIIAVIEHLDSYEVISCNHNEIEFVIDLAIYFVLICFLIYFWQLLLLKIFYDIYKFNQFDFADILILLVFPVLRQEIIIPYVIYSLYSWFIHMQNLIIMKWMKMLIKNQNIKIFLG